MSAKHNRMLLLLVILSVVLLGSASLSRADDDEATRIYKLARALHDEDTQNGSYTAWVNGDLGRDPSAKPEGLKIGAKMPDFKFSVFGKKAKITSADLKPPYLMNFWASWCPACRAEFPLLTKTVADGKLTVPVVLVNVNDTKADAELFLLTYPTDLPILVDDRNAFSDAVQIAAIPQTILVDATGKLQAIQSGEMTETAMKFFIEIAVHPGVGGFDRDHPELVPTPIATPSSVSLSAG